MAKKADLLQKANELGLNVSAKNTIAEIEAAIDSATKTNKNVEVAHPNTETTEVAETESESSAKGVAKAGKRSAKALKEAEAKTAKEERLTENAETPKVHPPLKPARSRLERQGKKFREAAKLIEKDKVYSLKDAMELVTKTSPVKFDASVDLHINLSVDPRQADQNVRGTLVLPGGTGKSVRIAVFADDKVDGADVSGIEAITKNLEKNTVDFDILIATPANMPKLGKYARLLGPRGLMPNPKSGTVTTDLARAVAEAKAGRVEYRVDSTGIVHLAIGKVSFGATKLQQNAEAVFASVRANKPASVKSNYIKGMHVTTSMGPSIRLTAE